jgi:hypothetical protein
MIRGQLLPRASVFLHIAVNSSLRHARPSGGGGSSAYGEGDGVKVFAADEGGEHAGLDFDKSGDGARIA